MNASTGKAIGIVLVVFLVLLAVGILRWVILVPLGIVDGAMHGFHTPHFDRPWFWIWPWAGLAGLFGLAALALWILVIVWVYKDAEKRRMNGVLWALIVFFTHFIGLLIFVLVRTNHPVPVQPASPGAQAAPPSPPPPPAVPPSSPAPSAAAPRSDANYCPSCGKEADKNHAFCPACGTKL